MTVTFTDAAGKSSALRVGEDTPTVATPYAKLDGDDKLYTIISSTKAGLNKSWKDLREKHLITFNSDKVNLVELDVPGKPPIEFGRAGQTDWQILNSPGPCAPTVFQVEQLTRQNQGGAVRSGSDPEESREGAPAAQPGWPLYA